MLIYTVNGTPLTQNTLIWLFGAMQHGDERLFESMGKQRLMILKVGETIEMHQ